MGKALKIACVGGGPAGLYFSLLMKKQNPDHDITVYERNRPSDTFGWGVVFSDKTLENFADADPETKVEIINSFAHWDDIEVHFKGRMIRSGGHGFSGIRRHRLLEILQNRAAGLGVNLEYETEVESLDLLAGADLIIACDGLNSRIRADYAETFRPQIDLRTNKFVWLGTHQILDAFTFIFKETEWGWFQAHAYRFDNDTSTFIIETREDTWKKAGIDKMSQDEGIAFCEDMFADHLGGHALMSNAKHLRGNAIWINFPRVSNETWIKDNIVLMGDAAHTAHFSIGSGTKLAMEDAIALARHLDEARGGPLRDALLGYEEERKLEGIKIQSAARNSTEWFENVDRYAGFEPEQFTYSLLTRSQRVSHENLRLRDREYLEGVEKWFAKRATGKRQDTAVAPMFTPFSLRAMTLPNRVVVSPMATYSARGGLPADFHLVHLGGLAHGGAGLIFTEMTCVAADARITPHCAGLWNDAQERQWKRIVEYVHAASPARICLQIGHAGPKGSTKVPWEGTDEPLDDGNWPLIAASAVPWSEANQVPAPASRDDMDRVTAEFVATAARAEACGFDMIELHAAHGYLLSSFISPLTNNREDDYGGSLENRMRFPLEVFDAVREVWPDDKPVSIRISATDWYAGGLTPDDAVAIARLCKDRGVDLIDVSAGQTTTEAEPVYGRMFQTPFADRIRNEVGIATMAVGNIYEADHVNSIIMAGRADLAALARPHLADPCWTRHVAAELKYADQYWPVQYLSGRDQLMRNLERAEQMVQEI